VASVGAVVGALGGHELLQLAAVQEEALALGALVDEDAVALVRAHQVVALGAKEIHA
jgi:hypothetical protein